MFVFQENGRLSYLNDFELHGYTANRRIGRRFKFPVNQVGRGLIHKTALFNRETAVDILDFSLSGAAVWCKEDLEINQKVRMSFELDNKYLKKSFTVKARIVRKISKNHFAIRFATHLPEVELYGFYNKLRLIERRQVTR